METWSHVTCQRACCPVIGWGVPLLSRFSPQPVSAKELIVTDSFAGSLRALTGSLSRGVFIRRVDSASQSHNKPSAELLGGASRVLV